MPHHRTRLAAAALAAGCVIASTLGPQGASAAPTQTPTPTPTPCPGTTVAPAPMPTGRTTTTAPTTPVVIPPPSIPRRDVVVGGERLATSTIVTDLPAGTPAPPMLDATSWVIADATSGEVVAAKAPHALLRPASTLKALTALTLLPGLRPTQTVVAQDSDMAADGTKVGIVTGNAYTQGQLMSAMLMASANDAVYALARTVPGGRAALAQRATALARELGALDTVVKDPSGLDADGQVSSAYDLALVGRKALQDKTFRAYSTTREITFPGARRADGTVVAPYQVQNHNKMLYNYPGAVGVKNGYTTLAHGTYIAAATRGSRTYLLTYMCGDGVGWREMAASLDWAFAHGAKARPVGELVAPGSVRATPSATLTAATRSQAPSDEPQVAVGSTGAGPVTPVTRWWPAALLALGLLGAGIAGTRRIGRGTGPRRSTTRSPRRPSGSTRRRGPGR